MKSLRPLICMLFTLSGCAALIYEIVWFQMLRLTLGSSALSIGIIVTTFMGGMCIGSLLFHRLIPDKWHPLKIYVALELGIAACGVLCFVFIPKISSFYFGFTGYGSADIALRCMIAAIFLLPPTILMGATLPAIARWVESNREGASFLGLFYSANIFGAVFGTLLAGFYLLRLYDTFVASSFAILLNVLVAVIGLAILRNSREYLPRSALLPAIGQSYLYWVIGLSGLSALGAQIVWTRLISLYLGGTVYSFSLILAVFLIGLGIGSSLASQLQKAKLNWSPTSLLVTTQALLIPAIWWSGFAITKIIPEIFLFGITPNPAVLESTWAAKSLNDFIRLFVTLIPATILWGASFPFALAAVSENDQAPDRYSGGLYAANTLGAVLGATLITFLCIPVLGTKFSQTLLMATVLIAVIILTAKNMAWIGGSPAHRFAKLVAVGGMAFLVFFPVPTNENLMLYGRLHGRWDQGTPLQIEEGLNSTVAISTFDDSGKLEHELHVSGKVVASTNNWDMVLQRQLGHLPALLHEEPKSVLIIGFGAGVTSGVFTLYDSVERIVIVEIESRVPMLSGKYLKQENYDVLNDPRTELIIDDGRHFLATTNESFDIITTDPIHPWVKGAAALYTKEFYELAIAKLNEGGLITQWVPFYEADEATVKSQIASFVAAFPQSSIWNSQPDIGYDVTVLGQLAPIKSTPLAMRQRFNQPKIKQSFTDIGIHSIEQFFEYYSGNSEDLQWWLADAQLNLDRNLRLEYLAGQALDVQNADQIYKNMTSKNENLETSIREIFGLSNTQVPK